MRRGGCTSRFNRIYLSLPLIKKCMYICCGSILSLVSILFSFVLNSPHPKTKENKIETKDEIEPQHILHKIS